MDAGADRYADVPSNADPCAHPHDHSHRYSLSHAYRYARADSDARAAYPGQSCADRALPCD